MNDKNGNRIASFEGEVKGGTIEENLTKMTPTSNIMIDQKSVMKLNAKLEIEEMRTRTEY